MHIYRVLQNILYKLRLLKENTRVHPFPSKKSSKDSYISDLVLQIFYKTKHPFTTALLWSLRT